MNDETEVSVERVLFHSRRLNIAGFVSGAWLGVSGVVMYFASPPVAGVAQLLFGKYAAVLVFLLFGLAGVYVALTSCVRRFWRKGPTPL